METHLQDMSSSLNAKAEHRKRQNRLNQRALRQRKVKTAKQGLQETGTTSETRPYRVGRWRAIEAPDAHHRFLSRSSASEGPDLRVDRIKTPRGFAEQIVQQSSSSLEPINLRSSILVKSRYARLDYPFDGSQTPTQVGAAVTMRHYLLALDTLYFPLSSDHLLPLIQHNALRALARNNSLLEETTSLISPAEADLATIDRCDGLITLHPRAGQLSPPSSLHPTDSQTKNPHLSWLDMFPSAHLRDNLIEHQSTLDVWDFCYDLFGDLIGNYTPASASVSSIARSGNEMDEDYSDDVSAGRCCLIVWGEPWAEENWEITPRFLRKWASLLEGCETLIESSNGWRVKRGEEPLQLGVDLDLQSLETDESTFNFKVSLWVLFRRFICTHPLQQRIREHKEPWQDSLLFLCSTAFSQVAHNN